MTNLSLIQFNSGKMSSKYIADRVDKLHSHVIRDIKAMIETLQKNEAVGQFHEPKLDDSEYQIVTDFRGYTSEIFLNERLSLCLAASYSHVLLLKIIDDWAKMKVEQQNAASGGLSREKLLAQAVLLSQEVIAEKDEVIKQLTPRAEYTDKVLTSKTCYTTTEIAKELGMSAQGLNAVLRNAGVQYKLNNRGHYVLYAKYQDQGYTSTETHAYEDSEGNVRTSMQMVWTERGRAFIHAKVNGEISFGVKVYNDPRKQISA